jgi:ArsR family transcriptional regulator
MSTVSPKHALFEQLALVARSLGNPHRLELLEHLAQGERSVEALAERTGLSIGNASQHLQQLRRSGLVANRRDRKFIHYRLADEGIVGLVTALRGVAERNLAEIDRILRGYFAERDSLEPVTRRELLERARDGLVTVLDVRPADEFALGHLPGAINVPLAELASRLDELDPDREVVAYCRGAYCVLSFEAVAALRARGLRARRLEEGYPEWRAAGLPVARLD